MALEQTVKDLQAQNAQFQEMILNLSKGQEELKTLLLEKKKDKKSVSYINPGRRLKGQAPGVKIGIPKDKEDETENDSEDENADPFNPEDDYEIMKMNSTLRKMISISCWKNVPAFTKYDGASCPQMHLRAYVRKIQPYTTDRKLWIHFFQESLSGTQLEWYYQLESSNIRTGLI
ncbi:hypothetical protein KIW84_032365 [Lathyrus oleraceus]|uniref:Retrotransposon gag protein n=1 Tax=Pisum sativum TaxID=3888 RepID=A0A9D4XV32_PEA|nr:hypothetical protein KIW84_032365 [Pisum sativum]